jgi:hypothetical protein
MDDARHVLHHVALGQRPGEQIALHHHRTFAQQQGNLLWPFDALCGDFQVEVSRETNDASGNRERPGIDVDFIDQASIELDTRER